MAAASLADPDLERLTASLRALGAGEARVAFVLGSGLGAFAERFGDARSVPFEEIDGMPRSSVPGHAGRIVLGRLRGVRVLAQQGRVHLYEGHTPRVVARSVRAYARLGVRAVVLTNAAGSLRPEWPPGTLMRIVDHVDLQGRTPLGRAEAGAGSPYDAALGEGLERGAKEAGVRLVQGVYAAMLGPSYETPAEIRMLQQIGAGAVGMSTAAEALAAHAEGARVAAVSLITNLAAGLGSAPLTHEEVVAAGRAAAERFSALLEAATPHAARVAAPAGPAAHYP